MRKFERKALVREIAKAIDLYLPLNGDPLAAGDAAESVLRRIERHCVVEPKPLDLDWLLNNQETEDAEKARKEEAA